MACVSDEHDLAPALEMDRGLAMHFRHQRAGGVDGEEIALLGVLGHRLGYAVGGENHRPVGGRHLVEFLDEDRALPAQPLDHVFVVHDFVADIDRRAVFLERALDRVDRPHHARAEAARGAKQDFQRGFMGVHGGSESLQSRY